MADAKAENEIRNAARVEISRVMAHFETTWGPAFAGIDAEGVLDAVTAQINRSFGGKYTFETLQRRADLVTAAMIEKGDAK